METKPSERLQFILDHLNMTPTSLARSIGMAKPQPIFHIASERYGISRQLANRITSAYPQFSEKWLIKGEGQPFNPGMEDYKSRAERVKLLMNHFYISKEKFAAILDVELQEVDDVVVKNINPGEGMIKRIIENYPNVSEEWLRGGRDPMLKNEGYYSRADQLLQEAMERIQEYIKTKKAP